MFLVGLKVTAQLPVHIHRAAAAEATQHVLEIGSRGNRCAHTMPSLDAQQGAASAWRSFCDRGEVRDGVLHTSCQPTPAAACALRRPEVVELVEALVGKALLQSVEPAGPLTHLLFAVRASSMEDAQRLFAQAAEDAGLRPIEVSIRSFPALVPHVELRPIERETLDVALRLGYYASPRRSTMDDLGRELGISKSAVHHRLASVEQKALRALAARDAADSEDSTYPTNL